MSLRSTWSRLPAALPFGPSIALLLGLLGPLLGILLPACGGSEASDTIYWCSMHPDVRQPDPGTCPLCGGMRLVPLDQSLLADNSGALQLSTTQVQQAGVRLAPVERRNLQREQLFSSRFSVDPRREVTIHNPIPGSSKVAVVHFPTAGQLVQVGDVLLEFENELLAQQVNQFRDAIARYEELKRQEGRELQAAEMLKRKETIHQQLEDAGVEREWVLLLAHEGRRRESTPRFPLRSPAEGVLMRTPIVQPGRFARQGEALFHLADISQLWIELEVHERDLAWLEPGLRMRYQSPAVDGREFWATIDAVEIVADRGPAETRVRARVTSAGGRILPGTWGRATVIVEAPDTLAVLADAVLRSGLRDVAIIAEGNGRFRPVALTLGRRNLTLQPTRRNKEADATAELFAGQRYHEVLGGLSAGEQVVSAGNFLLLSEASFQGALEKLLAEGGSASLQPESEEMKAAMDGLLHSYESLRSAFAADNEDNLAAPVQELRDVTRDFDQDALPAEAAAVWERLSEAVVALEGMLQSSFEIEAARVHFGSISRELVTLVRDYSPGRMTDGGLVLFRCPMADDYGFDLWFQPNAELENPYMGLRMLECGERVTL
ncbi:MAG: Cu(I)/Ag(I) efflux system membrane fusion protein [Planctomycetota bacterium]|jgi:Cu(I)/Ag(I) efflux system membrane fusion protein